MSLSEEAQKLIVVNMTRWTDPVSALAWMLWDHQLMGPTAVYLCDGAVCLWRTQKIGTVSFRFDCHRVHVSLKVAISALVTWKDHRCQKGEVGPIPQQWSDSRT